MVDAKAFRDGVGKLLAEVQRIKSEGDYAAAKKLFETYGIHFDAKLRDEVVARVDKLNLPSYSGFVMPKLTAGHRAGRSDHRRDDLAIRWTSRRRCSSIQGCGSRSARGGPQPVTVGGPPCQRSRAAPTRGRSSFSPKFCTSAGHHIR